MAKTEPVALTKVTLHAARSKELPEGSSRRGYDFVAPLDADGRIDLEAWKRRRGECFAHRFWDSEPTMHGLLVHRAGGHRGSTWAFDWNLGEPNEEEEAGYRFADHAFRIGEYVSIREPEGALMTFRVVGVGKP